MWLGVGHFWVTGSCCQAYVFSTACTARTLRTRPPEPSLSRFSSEQDCRRRTAYPWLMECCLQSPPRRSYPIRKRFASGSHSALTSVQGFFRSLFTAGFSESLPRLHTHHSGPDQIDLVFDDRNITRAGQFSLLTAVLWYSSSLLAFE